MVFNPFHLIKQTIKPAYLGVDIGTTSIKIVEIEQGERAPKITNYAILENRGYLLRSNAIFQSSNLKIFDKENYRIFKRNN
ncbi:MAG: hypothetical protein KatS3mg093_294 [Candidatus Parcubacteria bacterium]|nr:MAG: hypothetical protein KatS3mg093_294 [Candidatus Parcubacteria bacterium]